MDKKKTVRKKTTPRLKKIRMLVPLVAANGPGFKAYKCGIAYEVGKDIPLKMAKKYIKANLAEEDRVLPPFETTEQAVLETA